MKLVTYLKNGKEQLAFYIHDMLYDTNTAGAQLPATMKELLLYWERDIAQMERVENYIKQREN